MRTEPRSGHFVVVGVRGGLGNQLFQFASALGIATQLGAELFFDSSHLRTDEQHLPRLLGDKYREARPSQLRRVGIASTGGRARDVALRTIAGRAVDLERRLRRMTPRRMPVGDDEADPGRFRPELFSIDVPSYLWGYFQTERYFAHVADEVADSVHLPTVTSADTARAGTVAVSFRRGDYVRLGWALPLDYYRAALEIASEEVDGARFVVFGDDEAFVDFAVDWVARFGPASSAYELTSDPIEQLAVLASCPHAVLANSSFAWWGAWLGERLRPSGSRLVLAPRQYLDLGADVIPARWRVVSAGA